jgi:hypothetical protein
MAAGEGMLHSLSCKVVLCWENVGVSELQMLVDQAMWLLGWQGRLGKRSSLPVCPVRNDGI